MYKDALSAPNGYGNMNAKKSFNQARLLRAGANMKDLCKYYL